MNRWMPGAERHETAAQGGYGVPSRGMEATAVVHHVMEGWLSTMVRWSEERPAHHEASYHFGIGMDGGIVQFVPIDTPAWHAGRRDDSVDPTWSLWDGARNPGGHTVAVAREGFHDKPWTPEQIDAAVRITAWVMGEHEIAPYVATLIGHYELNPVTRANDPGGGWDKAAMLELISPDEPETSVLAPGDYTLPGGHRLHVQG
ncbi:hypothetical protein LCGC14_0391300 [marine sediment metagenome]|uniref:N-acetylmuramoyl-L-alanine amidase n=1 Tax=marine sediment metagenome TaxID=412755 RepID=A0A0F9T594_9ZZZZ